LKDLPLERESLRQILYDRLLPHANVAVQHYQVGFQSGKSTSDKLFALRQILESAMSLKQHTTQ
jgi:hypothetical protein